MQNATVTGGSGFIGSALVRGLLADPAVRQVRVVDNLLTGNAANLEEVRDRIELFDADVRDRKALERAFEGVDTVFHQAAIASVPRSIAEPELCHEINLDGVFSVLQAAAAQGVRRVLFAASSAAYGNAPGLPKREDMAPAPESPYAVQKVGGEYYLKTFFDNFGLETVALRYFNVFGPRQDPSSAYSGVLSIFARKILAREAPRIHGDGEQSRDFIYVDNIVDLNLLAARSPRTPGKVYNGGCGRRVTLNEVWATLQRIEGVQLPAVHTAPRQGDVRHSQADITAAREELGFEPRIGLEEGLRRTLDWYRGQAQPRDEAGALSGQAPRRN